MWVPVFTHRWRIDLDISEAFGESFWEAWGGYEPVPTRLVTHAIYMLQLYWKIQIFITLDFLHLITNSMFIPKIVTNVDWKQVFKG